MRRKRFKKILMSYGIGRNLSEKFVKNTWEEHGCYSKEDLEYYYTLWKMYKEGII